MYNFILAIIMLAGICTDGNAMKPYKKPSAEEIKKSFDDLGKVIQRVGTDLYKAAEAAKQTEESPAKTAGDSTVTDANYEEVKKDGESPENDSSKN